MTYFKVPWMWISKIWKKLIWFLMQKYFYLLFFTVLSVIHHNVTLKNWGAKRKSTWVAFIQIFQQWDVRTRWCFCESIKWCILSIDECVCLSFLFQLLCLLFSFIWCDQLFKLNWSNSRVLNSRGEYWDITTTSQLCKKRLTAKTHLLSLLLPNCDMWQKKLQS